MRQRIRLTFAVCAVLWLQSAPTAASFAQSAPLDLWGPHVLQKIRDRNTLRSHIVSHLGYHEVYFDSEIGDAKWADSGPPYAVHTGDTIRIHGYLATPTFGGLHPAIVIGHGHGGNGSPEAAMALAALGYVALSIDGPRAGRSTGGPQDTPQAWISVEEVTNQPAPEVSYLYHYAYAGMRALTLLDHLSRLPLNPLRIDRSRFGVLGVSMGAMFTYYLNGVDDRVKGAVAIAAAGDWRDTLFYEGAWLYHSLYHYTRDGLQSGQDALNTISDVCADPTFETFLGYFDPIRYAPKQHGPLLTILGTHDQYFVAPAVNTTYDRVASAGTNGRFLKRLMLSPNGKHLVVDNDDLLPSILAVLDGVDNWFRYCLRNGPAPPETPTVTMEVEEDTMRFRVPVTQGGRAIRDVTLHFATQMDSVPQPACDFTPVSLSLEGEGYVGSVRVGTAPPCGPPATPENILYFVSVKDEADYTVTSKLYYQFEEMRFGSGFTPRIEHYPKDDLPVPPPPAPCP